MKYLLSVLLFCGALFGDDSYDGHALETPITNFNKADWVKFAEEMEFTADVVYCGEGLNRAIGFKAHMIEPVGFIEITNTPGRILSIDLEVFKTNNWYDWGATNPEGGRQSQTHYIEFPILGMISRGKLSSMICFTGGDLSLGYMSELNLVRKSLAVRLSEFADMMEVMNLAGVLSSIFDCMATETDNYLDRPAKYSALLRNNWYMFTGCNGGVPISDTGGESSDPLADGLQLAQGMMNDMFTLRQFRKTSSYAPGLDSMCQERYAPRNIDAQWAVQLFYPVVGSAVEMGIPPLEYTSFKNTPISMDDVVYLLWKRRDYAMGAYQCPNSSSDKR